MQTRRILLMFAIGLLLATVAASLVPVPETAEDETASQEAEDSPESGESSDDEPVEVRFSADVQGSAEPPAEAEAPGRGSDEPSSEAEPPGRGSDEPSSEAEPPANGQEQGEPGIEPPTESVESGERVIVTVSAREPGEASIEGLGLVEAVGPRTPAVFDLFTDRAGRFAVAYAPVDGSTRRLGTLEVVDAGEPSGEAPAQSG